MPAKTGAEDASADPHFGAARGDLHTAVDAVVGVYQTHPTPILADAAGVGFVLAQLRVGSGLIRAGMGIATGQMWKLVRQCLCDRP